VTVPTNYIQIQCVPNVDGYTLVESWNSLDKWDTTDVNWYSGSVSLDSDSGLGGSCVKLDPNGVANGMVAKSKVWFDNTQPFTWRVKYRRTGTPEFNSFCGLQCGETNYYQIRQDGYINTISPGQTSGYVSIENPSAIGAISNNVVYEFEVEHDPTGTTYFRYRKDGGSWARINGNKAYSQNGNSYTIPRFLAPFTPVFHMFSTTGAELLRGGACYITGTPLWGSGDSYCWSDWEYATDVDGTQQCARVAGYESGPVDLGGLTRRAVHNVDWLPEDFPADDDGKGRTSWLESITMSPGDIAYIGVPPTNTFRATGPQVFPQDGYRHSRIRLMRRVRAATSDYVKVFVRSANAANGYAAGDLLSDSHVPDNSNGLVNADYYVDGLSLYEMQYVDLSIPAGTAIYLEVEGSCTGIDPTTYLAKTATAKQADWNAQTKLQGVWIEFAADASYTWDLPATSLTITDAYSASSADNITLTLSHGALVIADTYSTSYADNLTISQSDSVAWPIRSITGDARTLNKTLRRFVAGTWQ